MPSLLVSNLRACFRRAPRTLKRGGSRNDERRTAKGIFVFTVILFSWMFAYPGHTDPFRDVPRHRSHAAEDFRNRRNPSEGILPSGARLRPGESIRSPNGRFQLICQKDGNLVLYHRGRAWWSSGTYDRAVKECFMQPDGNLVLYAYSGDPVWSSNTYGHPGAYLAVQDDGNVVIYRRDRPLWSTGTGR
jgi:hypothetical protein